MGATSPFMGTTSRFARAPWTRRTASSRGCSSSPASGPAVDRHERQRRGIRAGGVGGLDGYAEAFTALRKISGVVPSVMCSGFNAGGGSYLPGKELRHPAPGYVLRADRPWGREVRSGRTSPRTARWPQRPRSLGRLGLPVEDEVQALRTAKRLLNYLPNDNRVTPPFSRPATRSIARRRSTPSSERPSTAPRASMAVRRLDHHPAALRPRRLLRSPTQGLVYHHRVRPNRPRRWLRREQLGRRLWSNRRRRALNARFIRFCNLYNIPLIFMEDTTGFPGREQEPRYRPLAARCSTPSSTSAHLGSSC